MNEDLTSHGACVADPECVQPGRDRVSPAASRQDSLSLLAQLCARAPGERDRLVRTLAENEGDWSALLSAAADHGMWPMVCRRLLETRGSDLPEHRRARLCEESARCAHRNLLMTAELIRVLRPLERGGVRAIPFKGPVLAQQAYGDLALRQFSDLDIVLPHSRMAEAHRILEGLGYASESAARAMAEGRIPGQYAYRSGRGVLLELHTEKTMRYLPAPLDWNALGGRLETVSVGGQAVLTFSAEDTMMMLCVHGTKHFWTRLGWICDIAELAQASPAIDWELAAALARKMRCRRMWMLGLTLADQLLAAPLPEAISRQVRGDARVRELARLVQDKYLRSGESAVSAGERVRFRVHSQDSLAMGLRQASIFATRPTDEDWQSNSLPRWASPLYAVLRPLRIARAYGWGLGQRRSSGAAPRP